MGLQVGCIIHCGRQDGPLVALLDLSNDKESALLGLVLVTNRQPGRPCRHALCGDQGFLGAPNSTLSQSGCSWAALLMKRQLELQQFPCHPA